MAFPSAALKAAREMRGVRLEYTSLSQVMQIDFYYYIIKAEPTVPHLPYKTKLLIL